MVRRGRFALHVSLAAITAVLSGCVSRARLEALEYPTTIALKVTVVTEAIEYGSVEQNSVGKWLIAFKSQATIPVGEERRLGSLRVAFSGDRLLVRDGDTEILNRRLPRGFAEHDLEVGVATVAGRRLMVATIFGNLFSGHFFVGIYTTKGGICYEAAMPCGDVWNVALSDRGVVISGATKRMEVVPPPLD